MVFDSLPVAAGAPNPSIPMSKNTTQPASQRPVSTFFGQISAWADDPRAEPIFWLNGMAGTRKSTISGTVAQSFARTGHLGATFFKKGDADRGSLHGKRFINGSMKHSGSGSVLVWLLRFITATS
ncbi:hypothetical protein NW754_001537 [Fusarium falciforme]|nr:hypothetical protein NW754_001537 [Fusarium falciforme]